jgi:hypothetical protein
LSIYRLAAIATANEAQRAERRCGELLTSTQRAPAGRPGVNRSNDATNYPPTLAQMGLTKDESSRYQQLAAMPAEHFETAVATAKATAGSDSDGQ